MLRRPALPPPLPDDGQTRVLLISASMGAGHDGAARSLAAQIRDAGHHAEVKDFLDSGPLRIGSALRSGYEFELKHMPSAYDASYRLWYKVPWLCPVVAWLVTFLTHRRVLRWIRESRAEVVVSTYPLATLCLGRLRSTHRLDIPAVNFITDFGVHPLWVHPGIDLNLAIHEGPAAMAVRRTGRPAFACGPAVSPAFDPSNLPDREAARRELGLDPDQRAVLVVAGSWGVGDVESTWRAITASGSFTPVVVCGRDEHLLATVQKLASSQDGDSVVIGWTDQMPRLMAACDALVENAGGLTSLEAMRSALPVVSFQPIAGHGKENTAGMAEAGVSILALSQQELTSALTDVTSDHSPARDEQVARASGMFRSDPADLVLDAHPVALDRPIAAPVLAAVRVAAAVTVLFFLAWLGLTSGVAFATEAGAGVAHPAADLPGVAYIGVRLNASEMADPAVIEYLGRMHLTAVVDDTTASSNVSLVRNLVSRGINVENGGWGDPVGLSGDHDALPWDRAHDDAEAGRRLELLIDRPVTVSIPGRRVTAWDLVDCRDEHESIVVPNHSILADRVNPYGTVRLAPKNIYMINGLGATPKELVNILSRVSSTLQVDHLSAAPLATLT